MANLIANHDGVGYGGGSRSLRGSMRSILPGPERPFVGSCEDPAMFSYRHVVTGLTLGTLMMFSIVWGRNPLPQRRELDAKTVSVRLLLGLADRQEGTWTGKVTVDKGEVLDVEGWRFRQGDRVTGPNSWEAMSRLTAAAKKAANKKAANRKAAGKKGANRKAANKKGAIRRAQLPAATKKAASGPGASPVSPNGVIVTVRAPEDAKLTVTTGRGEFTVALADLSGGAIRRYLDGQAEAQAVPPSVVLFDGDDQDDYPAAAADGRGGAWVAFVTHVARGPATLANLTERPKAFANYVPEGGGDQVRLIHFSGGRPGEPIDVTTAGLDVWRPAVAVSGDGEVTVVWSENRGGNWDLYRRRYDPDRKRWSEPKRLTTGPGADADAALATAPDGTTWMAWQAWRDGKADILLARVEQSDQPQKISESAANDWTPCLAIDKGGKIHVAYDTYQAGNYDVMHRTRNSDGTLSPAVAVADSPLFEARPSLAVDSSGRAWVAYEERTKDWGKDAENLIDGQGSTLYRSSAVRVRCVDGNRRQAATDPVAELPAPLQQYNSVPRVACDRAGRVWLAYRHRLEARSNGIGGVWIGQVAMLSGKGWSLPESLARSDGPIDSRAALVVPNDGPTLVFYNSDKRLGCTTNELENGLQVSALLAPTGGSGEPALAAVPDRKDTEASTVHPDELADIARVRAHRISAGGKTYRLLRGEFHRHTEISADGGNDGALEDMWRYAIDCAGHDWLGNGDHDNGGGKEYTWWITQKTTDLYHNPPGFTPMFTYERSVQFPHGHRNVMFDRRGIRTLPRLNEEGAGVSDDDTKMLYDYLKELGGICASHTSGTTTMGTDWRDNDASVEPVVEIFQGHRNSYEHLGAPRVGRTPQEAIAGMQPYGMIWNALALQYRLGFQSSSDHISTHISYAIAIAERHDRSSILDAFRRRHCYAATDNIVLDVRSGDHLMGDEFTSDGPVRLKIMAHGTRPIAKVDVIKDFVYVYSTGPKNQHVEFEWTDDETRRAPVSWYYVRVIQDDGELAWGSPMWVRRSPGAGRTE
jgi:hypothetical protein